MAKWLHAAAALLLSATFACSSPPAVPAGVPPSDIETELEFLIDAARRAEGGSALERSGFLRELAREQAAAMARAGKLSRDGFANRRQRLRSVLGTNVGAENIAMVEAERSEAVHGALRLWMGSPKHRANLLGPYRKGAVGAADDGAGVYYFTLLLSGG